MADLLVNADILKTLSDKQLIAAGYGDEAAKQFDGLGWHTLLTHGFISGVSVAGTRACESARAACCKALADASRNMSVKLLTAKAAYTGVDSELADNLDKQMLDK